MKIEANNEKENRLQDNVILLINGLSESGGALAKMLAEQGADVGIIDFQYLPALAQRIQQDVKENGRRCLVLTPTPAETDHNRFARKAIRTIIEKLGGLDAFITYSTTDSNLDQSRLAENGRSSPALSIFDPHALTKTALKQIMAP